MIYLFMYKKNLGIIGAGYIVGEYLKILSKYKFFSLYGIYSRTIPKCKKYQKKYNIHKIYKNYDDMLLDKNIDCVLIAVSPENMFEVIKNVIPYKKPFFSEKPIVNNYKNYTNLLRLINKYKTKNMIGYNRRYYSVFKNGLNIIKKYGKISSIDIEGNERFYRLENKISKIRKKNWLFYNSIHTLDLINFFVGDLKFYKIIKKNTKKFYKNFIIVFESKNNIIGTYSSNWHSSSGWNIKINGNKNSLYFNPLEKGNHINEKLQIKEIHISEDDKKFKPGFVEQLKIFKKIVNGDKVNKNLYVNIQKSKNTIKLMKELNE